MKRNRPFYPYGAYSEQGFVPPTVLIAMLRSGSTSNALSTPSVNPVVGRIARRIGTDGELTIARALHVEREVVPLHVEVHAHIGARLHLGGPVDLDPAEQGLLVQRDKLRRRGCHARDVGVIAIEPHRRADESLRRQLGHVAEVSTYAATELRVVLVSSLGLHR